MSNEESKWKSEIRNPGLVLNLNDKFTSVLPVLFDGLKVSVHKPLSSHFKVIHNIFFSSITPGNYRFGAVYVGDKEIGSNELAPVYSFGTKKETERQQSSPVLFGDMSPSGNLNATMYHLFGSRFKVKFDSQMEYGSFSSSQLAGHYFGDKFTASGILANSDVMKRTGSLLLQFLQNVTPHVALGVEFAYLRHLQSFKPNSALDLENKEFSQVALMGRYSSPHTVWSLVVSVNNILLNCYKRASEQIEFGIELNSNFRSWESVGTLGFKVRLAGTGVVFRGMVDTNTNVGSVFEKRFCNSPIAFSVSTNLNHRSSDFRLGLGIIVEG